MLNTRSMTSHTDISPCVTEDSQKGTLKLLGFFTGYHTWVVHIMNVVTYVRWGSYLILIHLLCTFSLVIIYKFLIIFVVSGREWVLEGQKWYKSKFLFKYAYKLRDSQWIETNRILGEPISLSSWPSEIQTYFVSFIATNLAFWIQFFFYISSHYDHDSIIAL